MNELCVVIRAHKKYKMRIEFHIGPYPENTIPKITVHNTSHVS